MIYPAIKRILPVFALGLIIYTILFVAYIGMFQATDMMIGKQAHELREQSKDDVDFANNVRIWVWKRVTPSSPSFQNNPTIQPPELAYLTGNGDCSERSLLMTKMLTDEGIPSHTIYGTVGAYGHQSVEYTVNGTTRIIDQEQFPAFRKDGDGVQSIETVYDVYWFIPWRNMVNNRLSQDIKEVKNDTTSKAYIQLR
jgi:hypothetical protein